MLLRRGLQWALDTLFMVVLSVVVLLAFVGFAVLAFLLGLREIWLVYLPLWVWIGTLVVGELYVDLWFPYRRGGTTPAMRLLRLRIVTLNGGVPKFRDYFLRWLLMVVDGMFLGLVGAVLILVTPRHQRLGDMVARTLVVRDGVDESPRRQSAEVAVRGGDPVRHGLTQLG
ncbi:putative RDD family membrane protein YckC [Actinophytocola oryzae]|uniref:Putative RDD family membrane protein YckC n=2 Tax=Actinophytocola oryzae TaxID=502181 RepID=A0A4R7V5R1_9PSEU|nr:putative RDD family membrane protein YckC [Actinophytocola oryzae]